MARLERVAGARQTMFSPCLVGFTTIRSSSAGRSVPRAHPDLNQGPADLRSAALTTELCTRTIKNSGEITTTTRLSSRGFDFPSIGCPPTCLRSMQPRAAFAWQTCKLCPCSVEAGCRGGAPKRRAILRRDPAFPLLPTSPPVLSLPPPSPMPMPPPHPTSTLSLVSHPQLHQRGAASPETSMGALPGRGREFVSPVATFGTLTACDRGHTRNRTRNRLICEQAPRPLSYTRALHTQSEKQIRIVGKLARE